MAKKPALSELAQRNPRADVAAVRRLQEATEALRQIGVTPKGYTLRTPGRIGRMIPTTSKQRAIQRFFSLKIPDRA